MNFHTVGCSKSWSQHNGSSSLYLSLSHHMAFLIVFLIWEIWINPICFFLAARGGFRAALLFCARPTCSCRQIFSERLLHNAAAHCVWTARTGSACSSGGLLIASAGLRGIFVFQKPTTWQGKAWSLCLKYGSLVLPNETSCDRLLCYSINQLSML